MKLNIKPTFTDESIKQVINDQSLSKSKKMVLLFNQGMTIKGIAELMNVRYNFVYNVCSNHSTVNGLEMETVTKQTKKQLIIELFNQGNTYKQISYETKSNYNYVFNVIKDYKVNQTDTVAE